MVQNFLDNLYYIITVGTAFLFFCAALFLLTRNSIAGNNTPKKVLILSLGVFVFLSLTFYNFTIDDAYISLRYARNLANGHGLVFSIDGGIPVEGYTNFLWVLLETPLFVFNLPDSVVLHAVKITGIVFGSGNIVLVYLLSILVTRNERQAQLAALFLGAIPHLAFWAVGGLETTMYSFWLLLGLYTFFVAQRSGKTQIWSMVFFTLMALTRPEGLLFVCVFFLIQTIYLARSPRSVDTSSTMRKIIASLAFFILVYGIYFLWKFNYYGFPLPNSFYAKHSHLNPFHFVRRLIQMSPFLLYLLPMFAIGWYGYFWVPNHQKNERTILFLSMLALILFSFIPRGEWMPGFRYELPFLPILAVFFSVGLEKMVFSQMIEPRNKWKVNIAQFGALLILGIYLCYPVLSLINEKKKYNAALNRANEFGKWFKQFARDGYCYASWDMGVVPYISELPCIIDINPEGLLSTQTTQNKYDVDQFLAQQPNFIVLPEEFPSNKESKLHHFLSNSNFVSNYEFIFSYCIGKEYVFKVYKSSRTTLTQKAMDDARLLSEKSFSSR